MGRDQKAKEDAGRNKSMHINPRLAEQGVTQFFVLQDKNISYFCESGF